MKTFYFAVSALILILILAGAWLLARRLKNKKNRPGQAALLKLKKKAKSLASRPGLIPAADFFKKPELSGVKISPSGKYLAYLKPFQNRLNIYVRKADGSEPERRVTSQTSRGIRYFSWKEDETLLFFQDSGGDENWHVFRASAAGGDERDLTPFKGAKFTVIDWLDEIDEEHILIGSNERDRTVFDACRLNIKTGERRMIAKNPGHWTDWLADHEGRLRAAVSSEGLESSVYYRETESAPFQKIMTAGLEDDFRPVLFTADSKSLYVLSNLGRDTAALQVFDPQKRRVLATLFSHPKADVDDIGWSKKRKALLYAGYYTEKQGRRFFDSREEKIFRDLESKIPGKEVYKLSSSRSESMMTFGAYSDRSPAVYYLYDEPSGKLKKIGGAMPWIKEGDMAEQKPVSYTSRDGLVIHGYLTLPKGASGKNLPVVVNPHGGPWSRDWWGFRPETQFLASRGYAVLQMNFRGSTGCGKKFLTASFKQWGRKMQDDITDGVRYLIDKGIADPERTAIYGVSYGGYAVLAGLAFTPDLYACGVNYVGISNLFTHFKSYPAYWEHHKEKDYKMIGHPEKDKRLLREASPLFSAGKIKAPLFVAHGANDPRVKQAESDQIVQSLEERGIEVPYLVKDDEGHGFQNEENQMEFYALMEAFLDGCLN